MKTLELITPTKIDNTLIASAIIENFPRKKTIIQNNDIQLFVGKTPYNFYINFDMALPMTEDILCFEPEDFKLIPYENAICTPLFYHLEEVIIPVIQTILKYYSSLYIRDNEVDIVESAESFIKRMSQ